MIAETLVSGEQNAQEQPAQQIRCRFCHEVLTVKPDSIEARKRQADPYQQMRSHVLKQHSLLALKHARRCGWLFDMLCFEEVTDPVNWRAQIAEMVDYLLKEPV